MNKWSEALKEPYPECIGCGQCCTCVTPSVAGVKLLERAGENDDFTREFLSVFVPFNNINEAREVNDYAVEKSFEICEQEGSKVSRDEVVFYHCRFISKDNKCLVYEDRPQLCRDHPATPFIMIPSGCAYEQWAITCREKYFDMQDKIEKFKELKKEFEKLKYQIKVERTLGHLKNISNPDHKFIALVPSMSLVSPGTSWIKIY